MFCLGAHKKRKCQDLEMRHRYPIQCIYLLCAMYTARAIQVNKPWTVPLKNSGRSIDHCCPSCTKRSRLMGQKERFCWTDRKKMNCSYNLGTHTINTFWTQWMGGPLCCLTLWHLEYIVVCAQQFYIMGMGERDETVNLEQRSVPHGGTG